MDFSDSIVLRNVKAHVQAAIVSMAVVIWDVSKAGRGIIVIKEMSYQVYINLIYPINIMRFIQCLQFIYTCAYMNMPKMGLMQNKIIGWFICITFWYMYMYDLNLNACAFMKKKIEISK